jgi:DNA polymerase III delta subunit
MLSDWVAGRNRAEVFTVLDELLLRQHPVQLFALAQTYLNNAYRLRLWKQVGLSEGEMVERTKKHPYKLKMDLQEFGAIPLARLAMLKARITELEWQFKSGQLPDRLAFETLMSL